VDKDYLALVEGEYEPREEWDSIDLPIGPGPKRNGTMRVDLKSGKHAETLVRAERTYRGYTLLRCRPRTGRTHQIRVHLAQRGFPLAVDPLYGRRTAMTLSEIKASYRPKPGRREAPLIERLSLHAQRLAFPSSKGQRVVVEAPLPGDFERLLKQLDKVRGRAS
jgi:23S rRNA-/tRNA-specific pseudouridylate synthase